jgi:hypothetical protein
MMNYTIELQLTPSYRIPLGMHLRSVLQWQKQQHSYAPGIRMRLGMQRREAELADTHPFCQVDVPPSRISEQLPGLHLPELMELVTLLKLGLYTFQSILTDHNRSFTQEQKQPF